eukprot:gene11663-4900_t
MEPIHNLKGHAGSVLTVKFNSKGDYCISGGTDRICRLYNPNKGKLIQEYKGHAYDIYDLQIVHDNSAFASCGGDKKTFIWDVAKAKNIRTFREHTARVNCLCFNREYNSILATGSYDKTVRLWDLKSRNFNSIQILDDARDSISSISMTNEKIITTSVDGSIRQYDLRMGQLIEDELDGGVIATSRLSNDDKSIAISTLDSTIKLMDLSDAEILNEYKGHKNTMFKVECIFYKNYLLSGSEDGNIYVWNIIDGKLVKTIHEHKSAVCSMDVSEDLLLTGSQVYEKGEDIPRYIRLKENTKENIEKFEKETNSNLIEVKWLPYNFYELSSSIKIVNSDMYKHGNIYGMDASSALAVVVLDLKKGDSVLDLCCAPGTKLCFISDYLKLFCQTDDYKVTGVDVSKERLFITKSQLQKYKIENTRIILADGTNFFIDDENIPYKSKNLTKLLKKENLNISEAGILFYQTKGIFQEERIQKEKKKMKNKIECTIKKQKLENKDVKIKTVLTEEKIEMFDKVLVDAECSTDGNIKHILQLDNSGWSNFEKIFNDENKLKEISNLQKKLLLNGFKLLKPGGYLVYSTCSFLKQENEDVIQWLLEVEKNAFISKPENHLNEGLKYNEGSLKGTIRLDPITSKTSGFFLCRIGKLLE